MLASAASHRRVVPKAPSPPPLAELLIDDYPEDGPRVLIPRAEVQLVARFGASAQSGLDVYAFGARQRVHRKVIRGGQQTLTARLRLGAAEAVLGVSASAMAERAVALADLWGDVATERLRAQLAEARHTTEAAKVLQAALAERLVSKSEHHIHTKLARAAAQRLAFDNVSVVAFELGVSERHLRRVFLEVVGVSPKAYAKLTRFQRAVRAASENTGDSWAGIAAAAGYYDQAHLIAEFRAISGVTPRTLLGELGAGVGRVGDASQPVAEQRAFG